MAPRVFQQESFPSGPAWEVVQEILDATSGDQPTMIRDHAILMILAVYGVRSRELTRLRLDDIDWQKENTFHPAQSSAGPLVSAAGVRGLSHRPVPQRGETEISVPRSFSDQACAHRPAVGRGVGAVGVRLRGRGLSIKHHGPHSLGHACATRLINEGCL